MNEVIIYQPFAKVDLNDSFFHSLRADYYGFDDWFKRKVEQGACAFVQYDGMGKIAAFLYLKSEAGESLTDIIPERPSCRRLKIGTFKIEAHNTRLGERFIKKIVDVAIYYSFEEVYVTIFPKYAELINLLSLYGFEEKGRKGEELVLVKNMRIFKGDILKDYPLLSTANKRKFVLSIYPKFHTRLFPDSILRNEEGIKEELIKDVSYTNSIHKIYICFMPNAANLRPGDIIAIYRTSDRVGQACYRSVITSICQVEEVRTKSDFHNLDDFSKYTNFYSVFDAEDLAQWYRSKKNLIVIKMIYNIALTKRVTRGYLIDEAEFSATQYWGFFQITDKQFESIIEKGEIHESFIVD